MRKTSEPRLHRVGQFLRRTSILGWCLVVLAVGCATNTDPKSASILPQGNAITDPTSILRYSLPIANDAIRDFQRNIEEISFYLRARRWSPIAKDLKSAERVLKYRAEDILDSIPESRRETVQGAIAAMQASVLQMMESVENKDKELVWRQRREILNRLDAVESAMVSEFPFEVPEEYADLPQLKGRATVKMQTTQGDLTIVLDGYSAPITAGNFADLVERGFYDGLPFIPAQDYVVQAGDPPGPETGFIDPETGEYRAIPLEILVRGDDRPVYGATLEELGRYREQPVLPFSAYGTVALARPSSKPNGGSSQFFCFLFEADLTPAGLNLLDGRFAAFGYVVEGQEVLSKIAPREDTILSARIVEGAQNLVRSQPGAA